MYMSVFSTEGSTFIQLMRRSKGSPGCLSYEQRLSRLGLQSHNFRTIVKLFQCKITMRLDIGKCVQDDVFYGSEGTAGAGLH